MEMYAGFVFFVWGVIIGAFLRDLFIKPARQSHEHAVGALIIEFIDRGTSLLRFAPHCSCSRDFTTTHANGREGKMRLTIYGEQFQEVETDA